MNYSFYGKGKLINILCEYKINKRHSMCCYMRCIKKAHQFTNTSYVV